MQEFRIWKKIPTSVIRSLVNSSLLTFNTVYRVPYISRLLLLMTQTFFVNLFLLLYSQGSRVPQINNDFTWHIFQRQNLINRYLL